MIYTFFLGSYTELLTPSFGGLGDGIYTTQFDTKTKQLNKIHTKKVRNPSYLVISENNQFLYCISELDKKESPSVRAYKINDDFSLEFLNKQFIPGSYPCHVNSYQNNILVACYSTGNVVQFPLDSSGKLMKFTKNYYHKGSSISKTRQKSPHAHQVLIHPISRDIYVCDMGIDMIKAYQLSGKELIPNEKKDIVVTKGGGPRHMIFNEIGNLGYVLNELSGEISILSRIGETYKELRTYPTIPYGFHGTPSASTIRLHPNGKFLYAGNRGSEIITIFRIFGNRLEFLCHHFTKGKEIREFNITPNGKWLIACHQNSNDIVIFKIKRGGLLSEEYRTREISSPVCVVFLN
ncbi:MAG: lactonase family protein [Flavobacteriaceae bacterium]|nr:lactonase family protein [Flavobacteriaceae bacterium]